MRCFCVVGGGATALEGAGLRPLALVVPTVVHNGLALVGAVAAAVVLPAVPGLPGGTRRVPPTAGRIRRTEQSKIYQR